MANLVKKSFDNPDDLVAPDKTRAEILEFGTIKAVRVTAQPGWTWSECIKPHVGGDSCQAGHLGTCVQGSMRVTHDDGTEMIVNAGIGEKLISAEIDTNEIKLTRGKLPYLKDS